ncbi:hypothetical protein DEO23_14315 [Brachybacterium endophyticum]|uniref:Peptidoglycan-binding protein n=1 Tax=Brachybacterium endophyticum TaxID=2182385 RepID=A0A2U2RHC1_9MICO|nr:hypothetical protein [Brachybacterium endophyticum]PWH05246.1 hypothetical protein DEO23_14315 [Brachybacterium endophyticum]
MTLSRRHLLLAGTIGLTALATTAPAMAEGTGSDVWSEEFMTRPETREGFAVDSMDDWQVQNARFIIAVCKGHGITAHGTQIALATAIVESWLYNYQPEVDLDSGGLFQQRPSAGWGTVADVRHKKRAVDAFLGFGPHATAPGLITVAPDYENWDLGTAAQAVQVSDHPERYNEQAGAAAILWGRYADSVDPFSG